MRRRLYQVLAAETGGYGKPLGRRLLPRFAALRVVSRLRESGVDAYFSPLDCVFTRESARALDQRFLQKYGRCR